MPLAEKVAQPAGPCLAHAKLLSSSPADKAQLAQAPKSLTLKFIRGGAMQETNIVVGERPHGGD